MKTGRYFRMSFQNIEYPNIQESYALSFYESIMILDWPNYFGRLPIVLDGSNFFGQDPNHFGQLQIIRISPEKSNWNLTKMIWTCPKQIGPNQNNLYTTKIIWPVQNHFGPIEGQGIITKFKFWEPYVIVVSWFVFRFKPKSQSKTLVYKNLNWNRISYLLFILRKGEFPFAVPFTKIVDATVNQIITRGS